MPNYQKKKTQIHLIWDCYKAHLNDTVLETATRLNILLYFVPAGGTSKLQPLDIKVFGARKAHARKVWGERYAKIQKVPKIKHSQFKSSLNVGKTSKILQLHLLGICLCENKNKLLTRKS
jgi:hypothetical protein